MNRLTFEEFKAKYNAKYGNLYDFIKSDYVNNKTEITAICPIHGEFKKRPDSLLDGAKCPKCSKTAKINEYEFIQKAKYVHNNFFEYKIGTFTNTSSKVGVICPIHGIWYPKANNHLNGMNCPKCSKEGITHKIDKLEAKNKSTRKYNTETFINKIKEKYGDKYDLSETVYVNNRTPITVSCKIHGKFKITPNHLLGGRGCPKCSRNYHYNTKEIIDKFKQKHGNTYTYNNTEYFGTHKYVYVTCPIHGDFLISPANHLKGQGCPKCNNSKLENEIKQLLDDNQIDYTKNERKIKWLNGLELDFYLKEYNIGIECQGIQHFKPLEIFGGVDKFKYRQNNDILKKKLCEENGIKLLYYSNLGIEYPYKVFEDKNELLQEIINSKNANE